MGTVVALAALAGCVLLLLPVSVVVAFRWDHGNADKWSLSLRLWGVNLLRFPAARRSMRAETDSEAPKGIPPWLGKLVEWTAARWRRMRTRKQDGTRKGRDPVELLKGLGRVFLIHPTRGLRVELGGIDPALLASIHGLVLSLRPLLPGRGDRFRMTPDWTVFQPRVRLIWSMRTSCARLLGEMLELLLKSDRNSPTRNAGAKDDVPQDARFLTSKA